MNKKKLLLASGGKEIIVAPSGRKFYRHESDMGTVMEFNDGKPRKVIILDAQYRSRNQTFGTCGTDTPLTNYTNANKNGSWYLNGSDTDTPETLKGMTDAQINDLWSTCHDKNTAKQNCDVWMTYSDTNAVHFCRNIKVNGVPCDLPNLQTLQRIYCDANVIDDMDPTVSSYKSCALGTKKGNSGYYWFDNYLAWSSTEYDSSYVLFVDSNSNCDYLYKNNGSAVVPVLEI